MNKMPIEEKMKHRQIRRKLRTRRRKQKITKMRKLKPTQMLMLLSWRHTLWH